MKKGKLVTATIADIHIGKKSADFVEMTCTEVIGEIKELMNDSTHIDVVKISEKRVNKRVAQAMQAVVFNLNTMHSRAGKLVAL